ncbi:UPF0481 protein At3g47200-like [Prosopis cineraria]|uniref:UPF0481 protein At3g47200-like n=1 Tax=Prosopis cineraria TaxID=364024 RepID=UPI00240EEFF9|nr:UPF0481 protein At3g47200-like [Prosopis cineraria]
MKGLKLSYRDKFVKRTDSKHSSDDYVDTVRGWEAQIRGCYSELIPMGRDKFVSMILTDACFIIELFVAVFLADRGESNEDRYTLLEKKWPRLDIMRDLILLENQIPFFVLEGLFNLAFPHGLSDNVSFRELTYRNFCLSILSSIYPAKNEIFGNLVSSYGYLEEHHLKLPNGDRKKVEHLCGMLRAFYVPSNPPARSIDPNMTVKCSCTVNQLHEAGLKFEVHQDKGIFQLECSEGVIKMPVIGINALTEIMLRNLVAFEQCHHSFMKHYVTDHVLLLFYLIKAGKDVEILVEKGIIENILGDNDDVATMIIKLPQNTWAIGNNTNYGALFAELDKFYKNPCHQHKANFVRKYWSTPWKRLSLLGGIMMLLFTSIQTICSLISLIKGGAQN